MKRHIFRLGVLIAACLLGSLVFAASVTYEYDEAGRLKKVLADDGTTTTYTLDPAGNRKQVTTTLDSTPPTQPPSSWFSGTTTTSTTANWTSSTDNVAVTGYDYRLNGGSWISVGAITMTGLTGLTPLTFYNFEIRARDAAGNVSAVQTSGFTTVDGTPPTQPPSWWFTGTTATVSTANWTSSTDNVAVTGYDYRVNGGSWISLGVVNVITLTGLAPLTYHTFEVRARDAAGNLSAVQTGGVTTLEGTPPTQPPSSWFSGTLATVTTANWTSSTDNVAVTGYDYRLNSGPWVSVGVVNMTGLIGLTPATFYNFNIRARDAAGNVSTAQSSGFTTAEGTPPTQPPSSWFSGTTATVTTANWTSSTDNVAVTGYDYRLNGGSWVSVGVVNMTGLIGLTPATFYNFEIRARDAAGNLSTIQTSGFTTLLPTVTISDTSYSSTGPGSTTATYQLTAGGDIMISPSSNPGTNPLVDAGDWLSPKSPNASAFQVMAVEQSGSNCSTGPRNVWTSMTPGITWTATTPGGFGATRTCSMQITIRNATTQVQADTALVVFTAVSTNP